MRRTPMYDTNSKCYSPKPSQASLLHALQSRRRVPDKQESDDSISLHRRWCYGSLFFAASPEKHTEKPVIPGPWSA